MGLLASLWETEWEGHQLVVSRNEWTKGFELKCDGQVLAGKAVSLIGVGELAGLLEHGGKQHPVQVKVGTDCEIFVDGAPLAVRTVK